MNALFVTIVYVLTEVNLSTSQSLSIPLPCTVESGRPGQGYIEPISFAFTAIFGIMLLLQFICMLFHRFSTFLHIAASTEVSLKRQLINKVRGSETGPKEIGVEEGLHLVKEMQAQDNSDTMSIMSQETTVSDDVELSGQTKGKDLWKKLGKRQRMEVGGKTLSRNFAKNFAKLNRAIVEEDGSSTRGLAEQTIEDATQERVAAVQKVFKNRFQRKSLMTIVSLAQNQRQKEEIKRRATLLKKKKVVSAWKAAAERIRLEERMKEQRESAAGNRKSKVGFADVMKTAAAIERQKKLSLQQKKESEKLITNIEEEKEEETSPMKQINEPSLKRQMDERPPKKQVDERKARISVDNEKEWPGEHAYAVQPTEEPIEDSEGDYANADVLF